MKRNDTSKFPVRPTTHVTEQASLVILQDQLPNAWIVRIENNADYGIDGEIEVVAEGGYVEGNIIKFQIKGHERCSFKAQNVLQQIRVSTINYWLEIPLPIILFVVDVTRRIIYWIDVKSYIRDIPSVTKPDWRRQKTIQIEIPIRNRLPESLDGIEQIALLHKEQIKAYQAALQESDVADFIGYHIFILLYDGDIDAWEKYLREKGSAEQLIHDYPFVIWLKQQLQEDEDLINRIKNLVYDTKIEGYDSNILKYDT